MIELKTWLEELSLGKYAQAFLANEVDFDVLPDLTELDLEHLGVSLGDRKRLLRAITALSPSLLHAEALRHLPASTPRAAQGERRQVTVMFCDLVGSTEMSARLDPEDLRQVLRAYQRVAPKQLSATMDLLRSIWAMAFWLISDILTHMRTKRNERSAAAWRF